MRFSTLLPVLRRYFWVLPLLAILAWANWEEPAMHHFARPGATAIWQLAPLSTPAAAEALRVKLAAEPGVSACAISSNTGCVAFVYRPDEVTPEALYQAVSRLGARVLTEPTALSAPTMRQCPVPPGVVLTLDKVRFALNVRRFFVSL